MGRPKRIQFPGACYLVRLQGNNRQELFVNNQDRRYFLHLLRICKERHQLKLYAYCLQDAEVLLLFETSRPDLSALMQRLCVSYVKFFNGARNASGHVFQSRYKAWLIEKEARLAEISRLVHLACARGVLQAKPWRFQWSSCAAYVEAENREPLVDSETVLRGFGGGRLKQSVRYMQYLQDPAARGAVLPEGSVVGGEDFRRRAAEQAAGGAAADALDRLARARRVIAEVAARRGVAEDKLLGRVRWREVCAARREAVRQAWQEARLGVSELARLFQRTPGAISQMIRSGESSQAVK